ncbi:MAG TPA: GNAT family N-acetyltransferase [Dermatophilaceae bacterium]|nr:GNAT family N-acetyltransferase [Dermatophilaceae bacterium]
MDAAPVIETHHADEESQFELRDGDAVVGKARYAPSGDGTGRVFFHTEVDDAYSGQGLAGRLVAAALDETVADGLRIVPVCPFVATYVKRHPEYAAHVDEPTGDHRTRASGAGAAGLDG